MNFKPKQTAANPLFKNSEILNLQDYITLQNCLFAHDHINRNLPAPLHDDRINLVQTSGNTRNERLNQLANFRTNTVLYGTRSIKSRAVQAWNEINVDLHEMNLQNLSKAVCKNKVFRYLLDKYDGGDDTGVINGNINVNNNRNIRNNQYHHGIYQGWRNGIVHSSRWNT